VQTKLLKYAVTILLLFPFIMYAQTQHFSKSIYFASGRYGITGADKAMLAGVTDSLKNVTSYTIHINGYADNVGNAGYNKKLSGKRAFVVRQFLLSKSLDQQVVIVTPFGKENPVGDNTTIAGRQLNRRVDIVVDFVKMVKAVDTIATPLPSINELYNKLQRPPQVFCINNTKDTSIRCQQGTVIYIKAWSFRLPADCSNSCVTFKVREDFAKSDMILDGLSTTSNGEPLESQGMLYTEANDCKGRKLNLENGKDITVFLPTDTVRADAKIFKGEWLPGDNIINWKNDSNAVLSHVKQSDLLPCGNFLCGRGDPVVCPGCRFFFCRIGRFTNVIAGVFDKNVRDQNKVFRTCRQRAQTPVTNRALNNSAAVRSLYNGNCVELKALFDKYGVNNMEQLLLAMNKPLLDSFHVKTLEQLADTLLKIKTHDIELAFTDKKISYDDLNFYVYNLRELGYSNVDCFASFPKGQLVRVKVNLRPGRDTNCKLVFKKIKSIIDFLPGGDHYYLPKVPKGETAWIVAIKYDGLNPLVAIKEITIDRKEVDIELKPVTIDELKQQLKILDN